MSTATTSAYVPDPLDTLRESFALHLDASRSPKTSRIYLAGLDALTSGCDQFRTGWQ